jgi:magnesium transporter
MHYACTSPDVRMCTRRHCILFAFDPLRGIILWDRIIVLVPTGADSLLRLLENNIFEDDEESEAHVR